METLTTLAGQVIDLARRRNEERDALEAKHGVRGAVTLDRPKLVASATSPRLAERALVAHLTRVEHEQLLKLQSLMYFGRGDDDDLKALYEDFLERPEKHEITVDGMVSKSPLDEYLADALAKAKRLGIDIDTLI